MAFEPHRTIRVSDVHSGTLTADEADVEELHVSGAVSAGAISSDALAPGSVTLAKLSPRVASALTAGATGSTRVLRNDTRFAVSDLAEWDYMIVEGIYGSGPHTLFEGSVPGGSEAVSLSAFFSIFWEENPALAATFNSSFTFIRPDGTEKSTQYMGYVYDVGGERMHLFLEYGVSAGRFFVQASFVWVAAEGALPAAGDHIRAYVNGAFNTI